jgi:hypothetical protein
MPPCTSDDGSATDKMNISSRFNGSRLFLMPIARKKRRPGRQRNRFNFAFSEAGFFSGFDEYSESDEAGFRNVFH